MGHSKHSLIMPISPKMTQINQSWHSNDFSKNYLQLRFINATFDALSLIILYRNNIFVRKTTQLIHYQTRLACKMPIRMGSLNFLCVIMKFFFNRPLNFHSSKFSRQMVKVRSGRLHAMHLWCFQVKQPSLKLKTRPKQLLCLPLDLSLIHI